MGRKPKNKVITDLDDLLQAEINQAIRSHADESAASIYRRFGLNQRGLVYSTFRKYVRELRLAAEGERVAQSPSSASQMDEPEIIAKLRRKVLLDVLDRVNAGDTKIYECVGVLARLHDYDRIEIQREAEKRARELHDLKVKQLRDDLRKDLDKKTENGTKTITRDDVFDMIDAIMRNEG